MRDLQSSYLPLVLILSWFRQYSEHLILSSKFSLKKLNFFVSSNENSDNLASSFPTGDKFWGTANGVYTAWLWIFSKAY